MFGSGHGTGPYKPNRPVLTRKTGHHSQPNGLETLGPVAGRQARTHTEHEPRMQPTLKAIQMAAVAAASTIDPSEVDRFSAMAATWWDPNGPAAPLHAMNPTRLGFIRDRAIDALGGDRMSAAPLAGRTVLDVGCGGGLLSEPLARMGAAVTGIDASVPAIDVARDHAVRSGLSIHYRACPIEALAADGAQFDIVCALEIVEHVADQRAFCQALAAVLNPGGLLVMSTLNRTARSFAIAILGAEYVMRLLPRGTHQWRQFVRPRELAGSLRGAGLVLERTAGMVFDPAAWAWRLDPTDLGVNYILAARKPVESPS